MYSTYIKFEFYAVSAHINKIHDKSDSVWDQYFNEHRKTGDYQPNLLVCSHMHVFNSRLRWMRDNGGTYQSQLEGWQAHHSFTKDEANEHGRAQVIFRISWKPAEKINLLIFKLLLKFAYK
jgi:hypothetical protein